MDQATSDSEVIPSVQFGPDMAPEHDREAFTVALRVSKHAISRSKRGSLVDRGANGGILGNDAKVIHKHVKEVDVTGIDNHEINALRMVDASSKIMTNEGPAILIMRQYAYHGIGRTIHSAPQIEWYKNSVDDRSMKVGGQQCIRTVCGKVIPLDIINGLPYMRMEPNSEEEYESLPHVMLTAGDDWNPTVLDNIISDKEDWYNDVKKAEDGKYDSPFDQFGNYKHREPEPLVQDIPAIGEEDKDNEEQGVTINFRDCYAIANELNERYISFNSETDTADIDKPEIDAIPPIEMKKKPINYQQYRPYMLFANDEKIRKTFENTTQYATNVISGQRITKTIKSPYPANNVWRRNEPVATDVIFAEVAAICTNGQKIAQIFVGRKSLVIDVYGCSTKAQFVNTLEDVIRKRGAMDLLISDSEAVEISARVQDILRSLGILSWQSEPGHQHQDFAERRWSNFKVNINLVMDFRNVPADGWLLCAEWVADVMNHLAERSLGWRTPLEVLTGETTDISILLCFMFWDVVYVSRYETSNYHGQIGSVKSSEIRGRFVGFAWNVGHALTFKVLTDDTKKIICRSRLRLAKDGENNLKLDTLAGAVPRREFINSRHDKQDNFVLPTIDLSKSPFTVDTEVVPPEKGETHERPKQDEPEGRSSMLDEPPLREQPVVPNDDDVPDDVNYQSVPEQFRPDKRKPGEPNPEHEPARLNHRTMDTANPVECGLTPEQMIDRSFLMPPEPDGTRVRAKILEIVNEYKDDIHNTPEYIKFKCLVNDQYEEIIAYNDIVDFIEQDDTWDGKWKFRSILNHKGPLKEGDKDYMGSKYNVLIEWETGETSWIPLYAPNRLDEKRKPIGAYFDDKVTCAIYARENNLLDTPGWKLPMLRKYAKTQQRIIRRANQAKLHSFRHKPIYMYGVLVPRNYPQAMEFDLANGNDKWQKSVDIELGAVDSMDTFTDKGKGFKPGPDYKRINVHLVFAVKHDGRHKARLVAGGHLTDTPIDSVYSSVVSLRGIRILAFLAELNDLEIWCTDIGNAYLESYTKEKVYIIAGPEFGDREGHTLIITKALYGLKSSGLRWHERFADVLRDMGFFPSKAEPDIWMRHRGDHYEYLGVYVDDVTICSRAPKSIVDALTGTYKFNLKGTGPISFLLGCDFFRDKDDNLCYAPRKYIEKMLETYKRLFGQFPRKAASPLVGNDHPELDSSELLDMEWSKVYQSLIGSLQWVVQIGRFDVQTAVMTLSRFRVAPRQGHLDRIKRIYGYLMKMKHAVIRIRTEEPDYSQFPPKEYDWFHTQYSGAKELTPDDAPEPLGKSVVTTSYVDANLYHDMISGRSVTGILHLLNKTPIDTYSKLQATVETATFGSEFIATRTCTEQIMDLRNTLRYLGVPVKGSSMVFGDNESVVNSASVPQSKLSKRHNALAYHKTREAIAAGIIRYYWIDGKTNPADILSKHWDMPAVWSTLQPLLFWEGDTADLLNKDKKTTGSD